MFIGVEVTANERNAGQPGQTKVKVRTSHELVRQQFHQSEEILRTRLYQEVYAGECGGAKWGEGEIGGKLSRRGRLS